MAEFAQVGDLKNIFLAVWGQKKTLTNLED